jgi:PAS domain S-box-containing protein
MQQERTKARRLFLDRHLAPVLSAVFAGVLISTLVAYFYTKHTVETLAQGQITQALNYLDREVTSQTRDMTIQTGIMSQEDVFRLSLENSYLGLSAQVAARHKLEGYVRGGAFDRVFLLDHTGMQVLSADPDLKRLLNLADRNYFQQAIRGIANTATLSASRATGRPALVSAHPLRAPDGTVTGVVVGLLDTATFARDMLNDTRIGQNGGAYILSAEGQVLATPPWAQPGMFDPDGNMQNLLSSSASGGMLRYERHGEHRLCLTRKNEATGWILVVEADESEVQAPARHLGAVSGTISFLTLALVALALSVLRRVMTSLRNSESDHRTLTELSPVGIATYGPSGNLVYLNKQAREILGIEPDAPLPASIALEEESGSAGASVFSPIAQVLERRAPLIGLQLWCRLPDGSRKALYLNAALLGEDNREVHGVVATLEDITERMQALEMLHKSEMFLASLLESIPVPVFYKDAEGRYSGCNSAYETFFGIKKDNFIGKTVFDLSPPELAAVYHAKDQELFQQAGIQRYEAQLQTLALGRRDVVFNKAAYKDTSGKVAGIVGAILDITERKRSEEALRQSEERFSSLFRLSPDSIVLSELDTGIVVDVNDTFVDFHGRPREEVLGKTLEELNFYVDDAQLRELLDRVRKEGHALNFEARGRGKDGAEVIFSLSSQVMMIGEKRYRMTVARDITERIRAEQELRENRRLLESILNTVPTAIFWKDREFRFQGCNAAFLRVLGGVDPSEVIGKTDFDLPMPRELAESYRAADERVMTTMTPKLHFVEPLNVAGHPIWLETSKLPLLDDEGKAVGLLGMFDDITERIRAEQELRENRRLLETILNTVPLAIFWLDRSSTFLGCNQTFANIIGLESPQAVIGMTELTLPVPEERRALHQADNEEVMATLKAKLHFVEPMPQRDGSTGWIEASKLPLLDDEGQAVGVLGMFEDITERLNAVEKLKQSEERFSRLFRLSPEAIMLIDAETRTIADANEAFSTLTGHALEDIIGHNTLELGFYVDPAVRDKFYSVQATQGHVDNIEFEARRKDGRIIICSISGQSMEIGGRPHLLVMVRDVTELKKMQEMMIQTEKMISVGGIAAGIAHEINNPLGIVLQAAQNLVQRTRADFKKNLDVAAALGLDMNLVQSYMRERKLDVFIADIQSAAVRASAIIRHMLDFSRSSESRRKVCDIPGIIDKAITLAGSDYDLKKSYDFKRIKIERDYADDLPTINCTETEVEQVLLNLLRNAAQALASVEPPIETPRIGITVRAQAGMVNIKVTDNGPGMPPEVQRRVFEPFFTTKPPGVGTGLGLSVSYFIVTKGHGGRMSVSSQPGAGTVFTIDLPAEEA